MMSVQRPRPWYCRDDLVDVDVRADGQVIYSVLVEGHRYGVLAADAVPIDESR